MVHPLVVQDAHCASVTIESRQSLPSIGRDHNARGEGYDGPAGLMFEASLMGDDDAASERDVRIERWCRSFFHRDLNSAVFRFGADDEVIARRRVPNQMPEQ